MLDIWADEVLDLTSELVELRLRLFIKRCAGKNPEVSVRELHSRGSTSDGPKSHTGEWTFADEIGSGIRMMSGSLGWHGPRTRRKSISHP